MQTDAILLVKGTIDFGAARTMSTAAEDEEEEPEPKLLALAFRALDNPEAIAEMQKAAPRRRNGYRNRNGIGRNNRPPRLFRSRV